MSSKELFEGIKNKDQRTFKHIYTYFGPNVIGWVIKRGGTQEDGEDVLQKVMIALIDIICERNAYDESGKFGGFLRGIAIRIWLNVIRERKQLTKALPRIAEYYEIIETSEIIYKMSQEDDYLLFNQGFQQLSEEEQNLLLAHYIEQKPIGTLAQIRQKTIAATKQKLHRVRQKLRKIIVKPSVGN